MSTQICLWELDIRVCTTALFIIVWYYVPQHYLWEFGIVYHSPIYESLVLCTRYVFDSLVFCTRLFISDIMYHRPVFESLILCTRPAYKNLVLSTRPFYESLVLCSRPVYESLVLSVKMMSARNSYRRSKMDFGYYFKPIFFKSNF